MSFPDWAWLYFGTFGTAGAVFFTIATWYWLKTRTLSVEPIRSVAKWNMIGLMFLFLGAWFACGIGGPPGNMLSFDPTTRNLEVAYGTAILSIFLSVPGWACVLISQWKMMRATH